LHHLTCVAKELDCLEGLSVGWVDGVCQEIVPDFLFETPELPEDTLCE